MMMKKRSKLEIKSGFNLASEQLTFLPSTPPTLSDHACFKTLIFAHHGWGFGGIDFG